MDVVVRVVEAIVGVAIIVVVLDAAIRTFVLPRGVTVTYTRLVSRSSSAVFRLITKRIDDYQTIDRVQALYGPVTLLLLPAVWLFSVFVGFALLYDAVRDVSLRNAILYSGSALFTLGFATPHDLPSSAMTFIEASLGLALLALLIAYLPTMYGTFSRRETAVSRLSVRAGTPPSAVELLERAGRAHFLDALEDLFREWEVWFVEIAETHTTFGMLSFFRSPNPNRSWVTAGGAVLDTAALRLSACDEAWSAEAAIMIRSGFTALREIAEFFGMPYTRDPDPDDPISITREEFDEACMRLAAAGVPIKEDLDRAWRDFAGWRVNYDDVLLGLAGFLQVPQAPWSSDRSPPLRHRPPLRRRGAR
jgi:hypothetical protein